MDLWEEDEEHHQNPFLNNSKTKVNRLQFRKEVSRARWDDEMAMAEIVEKKGGIWGTTGIIRNGGRLYCMIEEILFLAERGALLLLDEKDTVLTLKDIHKKVADGRSGCSWEYFKAYRRLKSLGYIVGRHGVPWTVKSQKSPCSVPGFETDTLCSKGRSEGNKSITNLFKDMQIGDIKAIFDVYQPDSKFKKTTPGNPHFVLCLISGKPPSKAEVEKLEKECNGIPVKLCHVDHWLVSFFSFDRIELPVLP